MGSSNAELATLAERRVLAAAQMAAVVAPEPLRGDLVVCVREGLTCEAGAVSYCRPWFMVVVCGDGHLQAFDVVSVRRDGPVWLAEVV